MRHILTIIILLLINIGIAQVPNSFIYQGVAHNFDGTPVANKQITVEVSILQGSDCNTNCTLVWQELHYPTTNELGLFTIEIGNGQNTFQGTADSFPQINWLDRSGGDYYLRIRVDLGNSSYGNSMIDLGTSKILSVPYAIASSTAQNLEKTDGKVNISLNSLQDVDTSSLDTNHYLYWTGSRWNTKAFPLIPENIADLNDVIVTSPQTLQVLSYNGNQWINTTLRMISLADVNISNPSPSENDILIYKSGEWTNQQSAWIQSSSAIYANANKPILIGKTLIEGNVNFFDTIGSQDFVLKANYDYSATPFNYLSSPGLVYFGAFNALRIGQNNIGSKVGIKSLIIGDNSQAPNSENIIFGSNNNIGSNAYNVVIMGSSNTVNDLASYSFLVGKENYSRSPISMIFGRKNVISYNDTAYNLVVGQYDSAGAAYCMLFGRGLKHTSYGTFVIGQFNKFDYSYNPASWNNIEPIFVIGNGTSFSNRSNALVIYKNGDIKTVGSLYETVSPVPYKADFKALDKIMRIRVTSTKSNFAIIDPISLKKQFPSLVTDFDGHYAVSNTGLVPVLLKTIQEQQQVIEQQKRRIDDLEKRIERLEQALNAKN